MFRQTTAFALALLLPASIFIQGCGQQTGVPSTHVTPATDPTAYTQQSCAAQGSADTNGNNICDNLEPVPTDPACEADAVCKTIPPHKKSQGWYRSPWFYGPVALAATIYGVITYKANSGDHKTPGVFKFPGMGCIGCGKPGQNLTGNLAGVDLDMWQGTAEAKFKGQTDPQGFPNGAQMILKGTIEKKDHTKIIFTDAYNQAFDLGKEVKFCLRTGIRVNSLANGASPVVPGSHEAQLQSLGVFDQSLQATKSPTIGSAADINALCEQNVKDAALYIAFERGNGNYLYDSVPPELIGINASNPQTTLKITDVGRIGFPVVPPSLNASSPMPGFYFANVDPPFASKGYVNGTIDDKAIVDNYTAMTDATSKMETLLGFVTTAGTQTSHADMTNE